MRGGQAPSTTFVGRRRELAILPRLLTSTRALTLTGAGGSGKTRLADELVHRSRSALVAWVDLARLRDPAAVAPAVARAIGAQDPALTTSAIREALRDRHVIVVLDNCEHLLESSAVVATRVLAASGASRVLATSRTPLDIPDELVWRVPTLSLPDEDVQMSVGFALRADAVRLFVERARVASPGFTLDEHNCADVSGICRRLAGLPLAIELAAARLRHLGVAELHHRLGALPLLVGDERADPRHRSLRATVDWSHGLLDESERRVFRRLAVFADGFTLDAAEAVCRDPSDATTDVLAALTGLVDKSLVEFSATADRYRMLEPIREYADEKLRQSADEPTAISRCAGWLVRITRQDLRSASSAAASDSAVRTEFANAAAIFPWLLNASPSDALSVMARFGASRWTAVPVHLSVVSSYLNQALEANPVRDAARARGLLSRANVDLEDSDTVAEARRLVEEALSVARELGDRSLQTTARWTSANVSIREGSPERAIPEYDAVVPLLPPRGVALALSARAVLKQSVGDSAGAQADLNGAWAAWRRHDDPLTSERALTKQCGADVSFRSGDFAAAESQLRDAIVIRREAGDNQEPSPFEFLAHLAAAKGDRDRALRLAGIADHLRRERGLWPAPFQALADRSWLTDLEERAGLQAAKLRREGERMSINDAIAYARDERGNGELSDRERTVAALVADGLSDKEIAGHLRISERTAENHVQHIRAKLGLRSRAQIGHWVAGHEVRSA